MADDPSQYEPPPSDFATVVSVPTPEETTPRQVSSRATQDLGTSQPLPQRHRLIGQRSDAVLSQSVPARPPLNRGQSQIQTAIAESARFVGVPYGDTAPDKSEWDRRVFRFLSKRYKLKDSAISERTLQGGDGQTTATASVAQTPNIESHLSTPAQLFSSLPTSSDSRPRLEKKESVAKVVYDHVSSFMKRGAGVRPKPRLPTSSRGSFDMGGFDYEQPSSIAPAYREAVIHEEEEVRDQEQDIITEQGESIPLHPLSFTGRHRSLTRQENLEPARVPDEASEPLVHRVRPRHCFMQIGVRSGFASSYRHHLLDEPIMPTEPWEVTTRTCLFSELDDSLISAREEGRDASEARPQQLFDVRANALHAATLGDSTLHSVPQMVALGKSERRIAPVQSLQKEIPAFEDEEESKAQFVMNNILSSLAENFVPKRRKRVRGVSAISQFCNQYLGRKEVNKLPLALREFLESGEVKRAYFTYWVTIVQIVVGILSIVLYGVGPTGLERQQLTSEVPHTSFTPQQVTYFEPATIWIGPRFSDLILLGAKYSPCMRRESGLWREIEKSRVEENKTACCILNDREGCYQTTEQYCPRSYAVWYKWPMEKNTSERIEREAGSVCGQDPRYCLNPPYRPSEWPDDLTKWPKCLERRESDLPHMDCEITGRPCCIQLQGQCRITTEEYCTFVRGYWHANATLCSQVDCFSDICGMLPFFSRDSPDQLYRLFISLFVHAGVLHLAITVSVQYWLMVDLEALIGWKRMALVYIMSGVGGNLASAIFVPYNPEVGPSGSQLGILAALIVDVFHHRRILEDWKRVMGIHLVTVLALMFCGFLPWVDNWAHLFGFIFGLLVTIAVFPYINFSEPTQSATTSCVDISSNRRSVMVILSLVGFIALFTLLLVLFIANVEINCPYCEWFNCIRLPFTSDHYCDNKGHSLTKWLPI